MSNQRCRLHLPIHDTRGITTRILHLYTAISVEFHQISQVKWKHANVVVVSKHLLEHQRQMHCHVTRPSQESSEYCWGWASRWCSRRRCWYLKSMVHPSTSQLYRFVPCIASMWRWSVAWVAYHFPQTLHLDFFKSDDIEEWNYKTCISRNHNWAHNYNSQQYSLALSFTA